MPSMKNSVVAAVALTVLSLPVTLPVSLLAQQNPWEKLPTPKLHEFKPQQPKRIELKNGIVIFLQEDHELPFVSGHVLIPEGEGQEPVAKAGLIDLYGATWRTSGTAKLNGDQMDDLLEAKAAKIETEGSDDSTSVSWESLKDDSDQVLQLAADLLLNPDFKADKLELAKQQEATGIVRRNDEASEIATRESAKLVYGKNSPYTHQPELATIGGVTLDDLKAWHEKTIHGRLIVGVSGDFDPIAEEAKLRKIFEPLPSVTRAPEGRVNFGATKPGVYLIDKPDVNQSNVEIVGLGVSRRVPEVGPLVVLNDILGGGFSSRLFQTVRTKLGLAYAVGGGFGLAYDHQGLFRVLVRTKSASTVEATDAALAEIAKLQTTSFTEEELKRSKDDLLNSFLFRYDTREKVLQARETLEFYGYPADYLETYKASIEKTTLADLETVAKKYITPENLAVLVVGNKQEITPALDKLDGGKLGPVQAVDITIPGAPNGSNGEK